MCRRCFESSGTPDTVSDGWIGRAETPRPICEFDKPELEVALIHIVRWDASQAFVLRRYSGPLKHEVT